MNPTKQFAWKDRETAGHDLIQLAYYAPPFISQHALQLLSAIRSKEIVPELVAITLDSQREYWQRVYALRAISETDEDFFFPELAPLVEASFAKAVENIKRLIPPYPDGLWMAYDFAETVNGFVSNNPSNQGWFLALLDELRDSYVVTRFLKAISVYHYKDIYRQKISLRLRQALDNHPQFISLYDVSRFYHERDDAREWCDKHFDNILTLCLKEANTWTVWHLAETWERLREALAENVEGWEQAYHNRIPRFRAEKEPEILFSSARNFLEGSYLSALEGNSKAYSRLVEASRLWKGFIPFRAVATHYLGKLQDKYDVFPILSGLILYADDDWGDDHSPFSPIRYEAGQALSCKPSTRAWETIVEAFFIKPRNELSRCQLNWIRYMTDVLNGNIEQAPVIEDDSDTKTIWFRALAEVSKDDAANLIKSVL